MQHLKEEIQTISTCLHVCIYMHALLHACAIQCEPMPGLPPLIRRSGTHFDCLIEVLQGRQAELKGGSLHSWPFHEKRVQPWEWAKRRAQLCMVKQSPRLPVSNVSANSASLCSSRLQEDPCRGKEKKKKKRKRNEETNRNVAPDKSLDCVMTSAGTLKQNFSEALQNTA